MTERQEIWKPFFFSGDQWTGPVDSHEEWKKVVQAYKGIASLTDLLESKSITPSGSRILRFGRYPDFNRLPTLAIWARINNMLSILQV